MSFMHKGSITTASHECYYIMVLIPMTDCLQTSLGGSTHTSCWSEKPHFASVENKPEFLGPAQVEHIPQSAHSKRRHPGQRAPQALFALYEVHHIWRKCRPRQCQAYVISSGETSLLLTYRKQPKASWTSQVGHVPQSVHSKRQHLGQEATPILFVLYEMHHIWHTCRPRQCQAQRFFSTTTGLQYYRESFWPHQHLGHHPQSVH
ncbi:hypothetical protein GOP47_0019230 [Adiantum capillus-veneris]|uniref:Uncharacterized protein n=1 Tax=Adiantum capillus-veneris TaxID=13818 RepID=A0A9D4UER6_ADICA|nr:hypothetical protein GOP47_0019230 [Adiantum capillus-veneris]